LLSHFKELTVILAHMAPGTVPRRNQGDKRIARYRTRNCNPI
jgi:hypothetical protein